eukprot:2929191-Karenia_brevis.AAC.1
MVEDFAGVHWMPGLNDGDECNLLSELDLADVCGDKAGFMRIELGNGDLSMHDGLHGGNDLFPLPH